jgi:hypothetical protein
LANCKICAILNAREKFSKQYYSDEVYMDKEVLLCALSIKTMTFPENGGSTDDSSTPGHHGNAGEKSFLQVEAIN